MIHAGKYKGNLIHWKIDKSKNGAIQFVIEASLTKKLIEKTYQDLAEKESVPGYLVLIKTDGEINHRQVENLQDALNWDGVSLKDLNNGEFADKELNFTVSVDDKGRPGIDWINGKGFIKPSEQKMDDMDALWNSAAKKKSQEEESW